MTLVLVQEHVELLSAKATAQIVTVTLFTTTYGVQVALVTDSVLNLSTPTPSTTSTISTTAPSPAESTTSDIPAFVLAGLLGVGVLFRTYFALRRAPPSHDQPSISLPEIAVVPAPVVVAAPVPTEHRTTADVVLDRLHL